MCKLHLSGDNWCWVTAPPFPRQALLIPQNSEQTSIHRILQHYHWQQERRNPSDFESHLISRCGCHFNHFNLFLVQHSYCHSFWMRAKQRHCACSHPSPDHLGTWQLMMMDASSSLEGFSISENRSLSTEWTPEHQACTWHSLKNPLENKVSVVCSSLQNKFHNESDHNIHPLNL